MFSPLPRSLGDIEIDCPEFVYHVYMPIKMADTEVRIPKHLQCFWPIVERAMCYCGAPAGMYFYLTVKKMYIEAGQSANRPGWHIDGYGTDDKNFIWTDCIPTEFVTGYFDLSDEHDVSLAQMHQQAQGREVITPPVGQLLMLESDSVHRVAVCHQDCIRTFVKLSMSTERYNLKGNAHNYLFDYNWPMAERMPERNHPIFIEEK